MEQVSKNKKIIEYNILRVIAVLLVVIGHCSFYCIETDYGGINYNVNMNIMSNLSKLSYRFFKFITAFIYVFHMPLFFLLSGALFKHSIDKGKYKTFKDLIINKGKRLLIPFIIIALFYSVPIKFITGYYIGSTNLVKDIFIGQVLIQGNTHLWFLPTLFGIFCLIYIYIYTTKRVTAI